MTELIGDAMLAASGVAIGFWAREVLLKAIDAFRPEPVDLERIERLERLVKSHDSFVQRQRMSK